MAMRSRSGQVSSLARAGLSLARRRMSEREPAVSTQLDQVQVAKNEFANWHGWPMGASSQESHCGSHLEGNTQKPGRAGSCSGPGNTAHGGGEESASTLPQRTGAGWQGGRAAAPSLASCGLEAAWQQQASRSMSPDRPVPVPTQYSSQHF